MLFPILPCCMTGPLQSCYGINKVVGWFIGLLIISKIASGNLVVENEHRQTQLPERGMDEPQTNPNVDRLLNVLIQRVTAYKQTARLHKQYCEASKPLNDIGIVFTVSIDKNKVVMQCIEPWCFQSICSAFATIIKGKTYDNFPVFSDTKAWYERCYNILRYIMVALKAPSKITLRQNKR